MHKSIESGMNPRSVSWKPVLVMFLLLLVGRSAAVSAQDAQPSASPNNGDVAIVEGIVMNAVGTVKLCHLADEKSHNAQVRFLCKQASIDDAHIALTGMQLWEQLGASGMTLQPRPEMAQQLASLEQYSGRDFDRAFLLLQLERAETSRKTLRYALEVSAYPAVKRYENLTLQRLQRQIDLALGALRSVDQL